jgi:plasmid rolling circle replication initiator protein Rep
MAIVKKTNKQMPVRMQRKGNSHRWECNLGQSLWKKIWTQKLELSYDIAILQMNICSKKETSVCQKDT